MEKQMNHTDKVDHVIGQLLKVQDCLTDLRTGLADGRLTLSDLDSYFEGSGRSLDIMQTLGDLHTLVCPAQQGTEEKEEEKRMKATITLYLDKSANLSRTEFEDLVRTVADVAELSAVIENVDTEISEEGKEAFFCKSEKTLVGETIDGVLIVGFISYGVDMEWGNAIAVGADGERFNVSADMTTTRLVEEEEKEN